MTNLSKELCEICGIEPLYRVEDLEILQTETALHLIQLARKISGYEDIKAEPVYPDFEQPENFAKLFELITTIEDFTYSTGLYYIPQIPSHKQLSRLATSEGEYESESIYAIKAFLTCVVKCVAKEKDTANFIKQTEWVYG